MILNPFRMPGPMQLLCPWQYPIHRGYYVDVDNAEAAFLDFTEKMGDLAAFLAYGQLVLVTGDSGCGKSALARLEIHSGKGIYPHMADNEMDSVAELFGSIAQLQKALRETYEARRRDGQPQDEKRLVTGDEIRRQILSWLGDNS